MTEEDRNERIQKILFQEAHDNMGERIRFPHNIRARGIGTDILGIRYGIQLRFRRTARDICRRYGIHVPGNAVVQ